MSVWEPAHFAYLCALKKYQKKYQLKGEPSVYDPSLHPHVSHDGSGCPGSPDLHRSFNDPPVSPEERKAYNKCWDRYRLWEKQEEEWTEKYKNYAKGNNNVVMNDEKQIPVQAFNAVTTENEPEEGNVPNALNNPEAQDNVHTQPKKRKRVMSLDLMHRRLGHRAAKSLLMADEQNLYSDIKIMPDHDPFCTACKIGTIQSANKGHEVDMEDVEPGQHLFLDIQPNVVRQSLVRKNYSPNYLTVVDRKSRTTRFI